MKYLEKCNNLFQHIEVFQDILSDFEFQIISNKFNQLFELCIENNIIILDTHGTNASTSEEKTVTLDTINLEKDFSDKKEIEITGFLLDEANVLCVDYVVIG